MTQGMIHFFKIRKEEEWKNEYFLKDVEVIKKDFNLFLWYKTKIDQTIKKILSLFR